jgi:hypothetical protein
MNWYFKTILAQVATQPNGAAGYLERIGATPEIIQYITSQEGNTAQFLINEFRKNPSLNLQQLQQIQFPQKQDPYLPTEKRMAANFELELPEFSKWILVNYRKLRRGIFGIDKMGNKFLPRVDECDLSIQEMNIYNTFRNKIREIADWYGEVRPDISSYSAQEAAVASDEWHRMMAGEGEGKNYQPTKQENIVYGPEWQNPEWRGWTVQKVVGENDLLAEGNMMNHCVGSYCEKVDEGFSFIYSLRDPENKPHITIEVDGSGGIEQMQGNSNQDPDEKYRPMIKEWLSLAGKNSGIKTEVNAFEHLEEVHSYESADILEINEMLGNILQGESNEYGLKYVFDSDIETVINEIYSTGENYNRRDNSYSGEITESPPYIINLAVMEDLKLPRWPSHSGEYKEMIINNPKQTDWKNIQEAEQWAWDAIDEITEDFPHYETGLEYPQEENYESQEEFDEAFKEFEEAEADVHDEWIRGSTKGGFAKDLLSEINDFRKSGIIPSAQELFNRKEKEQKKLNEEAEKRQFSEIQTASSKNWYTKNWKLTNIN